MIPKGHYETLPDLPDVLVAPLFTNAKLLSAAMERGLMAEGSLIVVNNRVSQSVPHLHVHIVPRRKGDGLRGFLWPRHAYKNRDELAAVLDTLRRTIVELDADKNWHLLNI